MTNIPPSKYSKTTSEKLLRAGGWALTLVGSFLLYFLADGAFTTILFGIIMAIGIVLVFLSDRRVNQLKKQKKRDSSREIDILSFVIRARRKIVFNKDVLSYPSLEHINQ